MSVNDVTLYCQDCKQPFTFTRQEQQFYASRNIINPPSRCSGCRAKHKAEQAVARVTHVDQTLICVDCNQQFTFTANQQAYYEQHQLNTPARCSACRERHKAQPKGNPVNNTGKQRQMYSAYCSDCGAQTQVPFQPIPGRSIYCRNCYPAHKKSS